MGKNIREQIISEYKKGKGSTTIEKELGIQKYKILQILNEENLIRKKDRCKKLNIQKEGDKYVILKNCPICKKVMKVTSNNHSITCRNYYNGLKQNCRDCSIELQKGEGNPFYGKKHTKKTKKLISKSRKGKGVGNKNSMANLKWRKKASENLKKRWDSGDLEKTRVRMSEVMKETRRKGKLKSVIVSKKEKEISKLIKKMGYKIITSYKIDTKICDIFIPKLNLVIEYFGDYWHCNPKKYEENYFNKNKKMTAKEI